MPLINRAVPDASVLVAMGAEDAAEVMLRLAAEGEAERQQQGMGMVHAQDIQALYEGDNTVPAGVTLYPRAYQRDVERVIVEGWSWLRANSLLVPADLSTNGNNGWVRLSRRAAAIIREGKFHDYRRAMEFPKSLLHHSIADKVWIELARGDVEDAVFAAFKQLEIAVRAAAQFPATEIGVSMMRRAFHPESGPLTDLTQPMAEREALLALFAGAHGSYKNPVSHRTVTVSDIREAQEMAVLASHLLRIVDARSKPKS